MSNVDWLCITLTHAAVCNPSCQNGGICTAPNTCDCPPTWDGSYCQTCKLLHLCIHWSTMHNSCMMHECKSVCKDASQETTTHQVILICMNFTVICPSMSWLTICINIAHAAVCNPSCQNGGTCTAPNTCSCPPTWDGSYCQTRKLMLIHAYIGPPCIKPDVL